MDDSKLDEIRVLLFLFLLLVVWLLLYFLYYDSPVCCFWLFMRMEYGLLRAKLWWALVAGLLLVYF